MSAPAGIEVEIVAPGLDEAIVVRGFPAAPSAGDLVNACGHVFRVAAICWGVRSGHYGEPVFSRLRLICAIEGEAQP
jgi:hypothetical protein